MDIPDSIINDNISRGDIFHAFFNGIDHGKFFVIMGVTSDYVAGFFFINSRIHPMLENKPEQYKMQYILREDDYGFLDHTSFVGADNLKRIKVSELVKSINTNESRFIERLKEEHINELLELARGSKLYTNKEKELFFK